MGADAQAISDNCSNSAKGKDDRSCNVMISPKDNAEQIVEGRRFTQTFSMNTDTTEPAISSLQADFGLCEVDFLHLKNGQPKTVIWAYSVLLTGVGLGISIMGKYVDRILNGTTTPIPKWEIYGSIAAIVIAALLCLLGLILPNEKKKVMKDIETHFKNSPRTKHIVR
jgi:hypothetical protein